MPELRWLLSELGHVRSLLDIAVVALIIYWLLTVAQGTRAILLIRGVIIFLLISYFLATVLDLSTLNWLLARTWPALILAIPVIFQPEIRRALEQLGHTGSRFRSQLSTDSDDQSTERMINEIVASAAQLARQRFGALIVIEQETGLQDYAETAIPIDGDLTRQLLINLFYPDSPLHDGATLIKDNRVVAASVVLPLTDNISASSQLGTRHRAAIGVTEDSDALAVVISEETGKIAVAHSGRLIRDLDQDRLRRVLRTLMKLTSSSGNSNVSNGRFSISAPELVKRHSEPRSGVPAKETSGSGVTSGT